MNKVKSLLVLLLCGLLSACGIQIQMENAVPAAVNLGRGARVAVRDTTHSHCPLNRDASRALCRAFYHQLARDGYYGPPVWGSVGMGGAEIELYGTQVHHSGEGDSAAARLCTTVEVNVNYRNLYRRHEEVYLSRDSHGCYDFDDAADTIARRTLRKLTPHVETYCEYVEENEQNPALGQGARACAAGDWEQGRRLVQQALAVNPNEAEACYLLGLIERHAQNFAASDEMFRKAASLGTKSKYAEGIRGNADIQRNAAVYQQQIAP